MDRSIQVTFALEAKCFKPGRTGVGTEHTSRLISRLRHRQFGVFVTTSYVSEQAYREIVEDGHPILIIAGVDIVHLLYRNGFTNSTSVKEWLECTFPVVCE